MRTAKSVNPESGQQCSPYLRRAGIGRRNKPRKEKHRVTPLVMMVSEKERKEKSHYLQKNNCGGGCFIGMMVKNLRPECLTI
jgi:hypothetical protein